MSAGEFAASAFGFCLLAAAVAEIGQRLREWIDAAFGEQMQDQFGEGPDA